MLIIVQVMDVQTAITFRPRLIEYPNVNIDYPGTTIPSYGTFVSSVVITHNIDKKRSLKLAYSKRIERPGYRNLNPFLNLSDPYNISTGNPLLKPEIGNNFEFGYNASFAKGENVYIALIERINTQDLRQMPIRSFGASFTYKFGKKEFKKGREENDNSQMIDESRRN